jgi:hypothetical protein
MIFYQILKSHKIVKLKIRKCNRVFVAHIHTLQDIKYMYQVADSRQIYRNCLCTNGLLAK